MIRQMPKAPVRFIRCGQLIDATGRAPQLGAVIRVEGDRITAVGREADFQGAQGEWVDWRNLTVLPGFVEAHDHLHVNLGDTEAQGHLPEAELILVAIENCRLMLQGGITTMRDLAAAHGIDAVIQQAVANGRIPGPRIFRAGKGIMRTGGHFWYNGVEVDGADAWRGAVRSQIKAKVDWIKIFITGGVADRDSDPTACDVTREEIVAAIAEAHRAGRKVAGHGYGGEGVTWAIEAGMDSVEHGTFLTEEQLRLMAARGTWLVATAGVMERGAIAPEVPEEFARKFAMVNELYPKTLAMARKLGVKVAVGTDLRHARLDADMAKLTLGGYTPMEAIQAATIRGAELLGIEQETGTVEVGKLADLVAIEGDPLQDIRTTGAVRHVVRGGLFYQVDVPARELSL